MARVSQNTLNQSGPNKENNFLNLMHSGRDILLHVKQRNEEIVDIHQNQSFTSQTDIKMLFS